MTRKFNPLAAYGEVFPAEKGAVRYQDGGYFNASGDLVWEDHPPTMKTVVTEETVVTVDQKGKTSAKTVRKKAEVQDLEEGDPKLILASWLKGEVELKHLAVVNYVKKGFGKVLRTKDEIVDYLVNEASLVPAELVRIKS
jgi:hypothetical protein